MVSKSVLLALAASSVVSAQTFTDCNPLEKTCSPDPAFGNKVVTCDFTKGPCEHFAELPGTHITYTDDGAVFTIKDVTDAPTIKTGLYIFFGRVDVVVQASNGVGVVTSSVLQSDDLDEIDWEWLGGDNTQAQTNYFSKGDTTTYDRGAFHELANPIGQFHKYSVEWTSTYVNWLIDDIVVRTLTAAQAHDGATLPQTPMQIKLGTWVAGRKEAPEGTIEWAGGITDFSKGPFNGIYKSITITDYAGTDGPAMKSIKEYSYSDHSGSWPSIKVVEGDSSDPLTGTNSATSSSTSSTSSSTPSSSTSSSSSPSTSAPPSKTSASVPSKSGTASSVPTPVTVPLGGASNNNSTGAAVGTGKVIPRPSTVPTNAGTRGAAAFVSVLATGAGVLLAQYFL